MVTALHLALLLELCKAEVVDLCWPDGDDSEAAETVQQVHGYGVDLQPQCNS